MGKAAAMGPLAHMTGLPEHLDPIPEWEVHRHRMTAMQKYTEGARESGQRVQVRFNQDHSTEWLRAFLLGTVHSAKEIYDFVRHIGWPESSIDPKRPFRNDPALAASIMLPAATQRMLAARQSGALYAEHDRRRRKPHFRTSPPGVRTVLAANLLLIWVLTTAKA